MHTDSVQGTPGGAQAILEAARTLFARHGYEGVSIREVAQAAGVSKAAVFHHFPSKEDLYLEVLRSACEECLQDLEAWMNEADSLEQRLRGFVRGHFRWLLEREALARLILREVVEGEPGRGKALAQRVFSRSFQRLVDLLEANREALREGVDPAQVALLVVGWNVFFFQIRTLLPHLPGERAFQEPQACVEQGLEWLLRGISAG